MHTHTGDTGGSRWRSTWTSRGRWARSTATSGGAGGGPISSASGPDSGAPWPTRARSHPTLSPRGPAPTSAMFASGCGRWPPPAMSSTTHDDPYSLSEEVAFAMVRPAGASVPGGCLLGLAILDSVPKVADRFRTGDGFRLARQHPRPVRGHRALLPPPVHDHLVDECCRPRRGRRPPARGRPRGGCGLRARRVDHPDGPGLPGVALHRLRLPRAVDRTRAGDRLGRRRR